jgi:hypothetical protein
MLSGTRFPRISLSWCSWKSITRMVTGLPVGGNPQNLPSLCTASTAGQPPVTEQGASPMRM